MKKAIIAGFALLIIGCLSNGCESPDELEFSEIVQTKTSIKQSDIAPIGSIPEWVKSKVSSDIYAKLEIMSTCCRIDYSFFREDISPERWKDITFAIDGICKEIKIGNISLDHPIIFSVASENVTDSFQTIERLGMLEKGCVGRSKQIELFTSKYGPVLYAIIDYVYNTNTKAVSDIEGEVFLAPLSTGQNASFNGKARAFHLSNNTIQITCNGKLSITDKNGTLLYENVNVDVHFVP